MSQDIDVAGIRLQQSEAQFENRALARPGDAQDHLGFTALELKGYAVENAQIIKADRDIIEDNRLVDRVRRTVIKRSGLQLIERNVAPEKSTIADVVIAPKERTTAGLMRLGWIPGRAP